MKFWLDSKVLKKLILLFLLLLIIALMMGWCFGVLYSAIFGSITPVIYFWIYLFLLFYQFGLAQIENLVFSVEGDSWNFSSVLLTLSGLIGTCPVQTLFKSWPEIWAEFIDGIWDTSLWLPSSWDVLPHLLDAAVTLEPFLNTVNQWDCFCVVYNVPNAVYLGLSSLPFKKFKRSS